MSPQVRQFLVILVAAILAIWLGYEVASGSYFWPGLTAVIALGASLARLLRLPFDVILTGMVIFGYLVGNRGFAQLMPAPNLPLLPAEAALLVAGFWRSIRWAFARQSPIRRDILNYVLLGWMTLGSARFAFDLRSYGFLAVRDFATVYYVAFFFLVQDMVRDPHARRWLLGCLLAGLCLMPLSFGLSEYFPGLFQDYFAVHGIPLIVFKGDLAFTFFGVAALLMFFAFTGPIRLWTSLVAMGLVLWLLASDNRASLLGLATAAGLLLLAGKWRFPACLGVTGALAAIALAGMATVGNSSWASDKLRSTVDRVQSIFDYRGEGTYMAGDNYYKGHNNQFRAVWWKNIVVETWETNPVLGMGFGHDLAGAFLQEYYPEGTAEEFSARSPHNIAITAFGRMGLIGLALWLTFCAVLLQRTWQALRTSDDQTGWALWCGAWVILVSATFGVVLEGPMGAVIFWSILGLAHGSTSPVPADPEGAQVSKESM